MFNIVTGYFDKFGLEMAMQHSFNSVDTVEKTVYTSNRGKSEPRTLMYKNKSIPYMESSGSYKYLGVYINLDLNWTKQTTVTNYNYMKHIAYLRKKCFTASQTAEILNLVVFPAITYRMGVVIFPDEYIAKWDKSARNLMSYKLHANQVLGCIHWHLQQNFGGYNLFQLKDLQIINIAAVYSQLCSKHSRCQFCNNIRAQFL